MSLDVDLQSRKSGLTSECCSKSNRILRTSERISAGRDRSALASSPEDVRALAGYIEGGTGGDREEEGRSEKLRVISLR